MADELQQPDDGKVAVTIDGRERRVAKGTLVLDAAAEAGVHIPIYCAHAKMEPVAVCRMCLVHVEKMPKLQPACATTVADGMVVTTQRADVSKAREGVLEFLLLNHPLDCPVCDRGGECDLQDFAFRYGPGNSRFPITDKVHAKKAVALSEKIEFDQERCILCWRCTRYYDEITGEKELVLQQRGVKTVIETFNGAELTSEFQGNLPEVCPVGALTHRQYRFKARPWDLQRTKSVCPECSFGCNINVDSRDYDIVRFASRDNPLVEDMWLCDRGRYSATSWNGGARIRGSRLQPRQGRGKDVAFTDAVSAAAKQLKKIRDEHGADSIAVLASTRCSNEELWLLQRFAREVVGTPNVDHQLNGAAAPRRGDHELGIAEIEECSDVLVIGDAAEREAPVLQLRLFKAAHKRGVNVQRVAGAAAAGPLSGRKFVGVIADQSQTEGLEDLVETLRKNNDRVAVLTVTRGVNGRGAQHMGVSPNLEPGYKSAKKKGLAGGKVLTGVAAGTIRALVVLDGAGLFAGGEPEAAKALAGLETLVAIESAPSLVSENATVLIPGHAYFEKSGTVTNMEGRVQRIRPALPPATQSPTDVRVISALATQLGAKDWSYVDGAGTHVELAKALPQYAEAGNGGRAHFSRVAAK